MMPFSAFDVLTVHLLAATPVAILLAGSAARRWNLLTCRVFGGMLLVGIALILLSQETAGDAWGRFSSAFGFALRTVLALSLVTGAALVAAQPLSRMLPNDFQVMFNTWTIALGVIVLPATTFTYESARFRHDQARLQEYLEQSRLGDAQRIAQRLLTLRPDGKVRDQPLETISSELQQVIDEMAQRVERPLSPGATTDEKLARARELAMLGRNADAIDVLSAVPELTTSISACNLAGTIAETEQAWSEAEAWYRRARDLALSNNGPSDTEETSAVADADSRELARAITGLAFSQRKQGDLAAAEQSFLELLSLKPTADTYFLVATFYEDTQQVTKARTCARRAMKLAPDRYQAPGERLMDKLVTNHFGCLRASTAGAE